MNTMLDQFKQAAELNNQKIKQLREESAALVKPLLQGFLRDFPQVKQVKWTQYTPYFNDGEECIFSIRGFGFYFEGDDLDEGHWDHEIYRYESLDKKDVCSLETFNACRELETQLNSIDESLKDLFGDHVEVTVTANGVEVEEYDHD